MENPRITDKEIRLIKDAQNGNILAFNKLFRKYKSFVDKLLYHYIKDWDEAKDITNIVFLKVYEKLSMFKDYSSFGGWLRIISRNTAIDYLRQINNKSKVVDSEDDRLSSNDSINSLEDEIVNRMTYELLLTEFDKLSQVNRRICKLFYEDNMKVSEISEVLNVPVGTIKSILHRTRKHIKNNLKFIV